MKLCMISLFLQGTPGGFLSWNPAGVPPTFVTANAQIIIHNSLKTISHEKPKQHSNSGEQIASQRDHRC